ncbi:unnamed protein product, partial [Amoebophrya sp. A120]
RASYFSRTATGTMQTGKKADDDAVVVILSDSSDSPGRATSSKQPTNPRTTGQPGVASGTGHRHQPRHAVPSRFAAIDMPGAPEMGAGTNAAEQEPLLQQAKVKSEQLSGGPSSTTTDSHRRERTATNTLVVENQEINATLQEPPEVQHQQQPQTEEAPELVRIKHDPFAEVVGGEEGEEDFLLGDFIFDLDDGEDLFLQSGEDEEQPGDTAADKNGLVGEEQELAHHGVNHSEDQEEMERNRGTTHPIVRIKQELQQPRVKQELPASEEEEQQAPQAQHT